MKPKHSQQRIKNTAAVKTHAIRPALQNKTHKQTKQLWHLLAFAVMAYLAIAQATEVVAHRFIATAQLSPLQAAFEFSLQTKPDLLEQAADVSASVLGEMPALTVRIQNPVPVSNQLYLKLEPELILENSIAGALADSQTNSQSDKSNITPPAEAETSAAGAAELAAAPDATPDEEYVTQDKAVSETQTDLVAQAQIHLPSDAPDEFQTVAATASDYAVPAYKSQSEENPVSAAEINVPAQTNDGDNENQLVSNSVISNQQGTTKIDTLNTYTGSIADHASADLLGSKSFVSTLPIASTADYKLDYFTIALDQRMSPVGNDPERPGTKPEPALPLHPHDSGLQSNIDNEPNLDSAVDTAASHADSINVYSESLPGLVAYDVIHPVVIVVDPGHGGVDPGTIGKYGMQEQDLTLDMAKRLQTLATLHTDIEVVLTRDDNDGLSRLQRIGKVAAADADLLLSLHFNHLPEGDITLVETYYTDTTSDLQASAVGHTEPKDLRTRPAAILEQQANNNPAAKAKISRKFARYLQAGVFGAVQNRNPLAIDAGVKRQSLYLLAQSGLPGALVELTCLSNPEEEARLRTEQYRNELANSLMQSLRKFVNSRDLAKSI